MRCSASLRSRRSSTKATPWSCAPSNDAAPNSTGTRAPSLRVNSFSYGVQRPVWRNSSRASASAARPLGRRDVGQDQVARAELLARPAGHAQELVVRFGDAAGGVPEEDADDVRFDEPADASFALAQRLFGAQALGGLGAQLAVGLRELCGALHHALLELVVRVLQRFLRLLAHIDFVAQLLVAPRELLLRRAQREMRADARNDLGDLERLRHVVDAARLEADGSSRRCPRAQS